MPITRSSNVSTKRGKQLLRAIEGSRVRYASLPERVQPAMNEALLSAAQGLDIAYRQMDPVKKAYLGRPPYCPPPAALGMKRRRT